MKKNRGILLGLVATMSLSMSILTYAGEWKQDTIGWWWQNDDGTYPANKWEWLDGNKDGIAECYYFNEKGYCVIATTTPDNYTVNENGAWIVNGVVQTKDVIMSTGDREITDEMHREFQDEIDRKTKEDAEKLLDEYKAFYESYYGNK